ncbi:MAG TPA: arginine--tRNA ligase [Candidatus Omnitrophota bacterium]|nr:arginine--tRNA ligase [Candidatus Omnitrophota bacterium]HQO38140.1 arginine--tRNA ligase [Candidatus Omnitrophota bacterium]HQQ06095.1 arginine--tRNA ligase [Candidatus Omnitrophota bacterium]
MRTPIQESLTELLSDALADAGYQDQREGLALEWACSSGFGDISNNIAMRIASALKQPPMKIASAVVDALNKRLAASPCRASVAQIKAEGAGFINVYLSAEYFREVLKDIIEQGSDFGRSSEGMGRKVLVEFVSANPTGPLSVAHARQAAVGDALANILSFLGFEVRKEYYLNDEGNQINTLGRSVEARLKELNGEKVEFPDNYYQGDYIVDMARQIRDRKIEVRDFAEYSSNYILDIIKKELEDFHVTFDCWYSQKSLRESGKQKSALDFLRSAGHLYDEDGAVWFRSTTFGDDKDRVVVKSDGAFTYLAPDIAYHGDKFARGFDWLINLWGPDHHGYIPRLKAAVMALGGSADSLSVVIVQLASIFRSGKVIEMSTRRGQYITLREVLDEVGADAARYFFCMRRTSSHLNFDLEVAKKQSPENPVYYVQYAHARIASILRQAGVRGKPELSGPLVLQENEEQMLLKKLWQFPYILKVCLGTLDPYMMTVYLQEAAEGFHRFYDKHRVLGQDEACTRARICLIYAAKTVLAKGLALLGVTAPEQM